MIAESEYTRQAEELLKSWGMTFKAELVGADCPQFCEDAIAQKDMDKVQQFPRKTHIHGKHYRCTFTAPRPWGHEAQQDTGRWQLPTFVVEFWNSYADEEYNALRSDFIERERRGLKKWTKRNTDGALVTGYWAKTPTAYDVISCLQKYPVGTFAEFCAEFGYDEDSRRAEATWRAACDEYARLSRFFKPEQIEQLQEVN